MKNLGFNVSLNDVLVCFYMVFTRGLKTLHILKIGSTLIAVRIRGYKIWLNDLLIFKKLAYS